MVSVSSQNKALSIPANNGHKSAFGIDKKSSANALVQIQRFAPLNLTGYATVHQGTLSASPCGVFLFAPGATVRPPLHG